MRVAHRLEHGSARANAFGLAARVDGERPRLGADRLAGDWRIDEVDAAGAGGRRDSRPTSRELVDMSTTSEPEVMAAMADRAVRRRTAPRGPGAARAGS